MAWVKPRRSRPCQGRRVTGDSGGAGGSSPLAGGPAALGGGDTVVRWQRGAGAARDGCHHWPVVITAAAAVASQLSPSGFGGPGQNQGAKGLSLGPFEVRGTGWIHAERRAARICSCNRNATEAKRLKELEQENNRLKRLLAAAELDSHAQGACRGKRLSPEPRRRAVMGLQDRFRVSERRVSLFAD